MAIVEQLGNVLDAAIDGLLVAVDGDHPRLVGAVAHQLAKRLDDEDEWARILEDAAVPIPADAGRVVDTEGVRPRARRWSAPLTGIPRSKYGCSSSLNARGSAATSCA